MPVPVPVQEILNVFVTFGSAFAGAWVAFKLERSRAGAEEEERNVGAANRAIYTLFSCWNFLEQYRKEVIEVWRGKPDAWLNLHASPVKSTGLCKFDVDSLQFILQTKHANVFAELLLEEQRFDTVVSLIEERTRIVLNEVFPTYSAHGVKFRQSFSSDEIEKLLGTSIVHRLKVITGAIEGMVDSDLASLVSADANLRTAISSLYPRRKIIQIERNPPAKNH